jgi:hypothetical protein
MGQFDDIIQAGSSTRNPVIPPVPMNRPGMVVPETVEMRKKGKARNLALETPSPGQLDASLGIPAPRGSSSDLIQPSLERQARVEQSKIKGTASAAKGKSDRAVGREKRRKEVAKDLSTTTMRMINGVAVDTDYGKPTSNLLSKSYVKPTGQDPDFTPTPVTDTQVSEIMNPGKAARDAKYAEDAATESTRQDLLSGENAFNAREASRGSTTRSVNGITYDTADMSAEIMSAPGKGSGTYLSDLGMAADANDVIPKSTIAPKKPVDPSNQDNYRPSSIVPTAPQLENLGDSGAVENKDVDNYNVPGKDSTKTDIEKDSDYKAEQARLAEVKESSASNADNAMDKKLQEQAMADSIKTRKEKGKRNPKAAKVDSRTVPFDQQDLWDKDGNVKPEYDDPNSPSSTTMVAKKNWDIQPIYKSPELQAKHEKRQKYADDVNNTIQSESLKHLDTEYASADESKAAFARLQTRHAKLRSDIDKYHPVPAGGYFNENVDKDTSTESYEEMPGVKIQPSPQPQIAKDNSGVVPERLMNQPEQVSDAQLAVDDRNASRNRTAVTGTRQLTFNNIAARPARGRTREQELIDLSQAASRNQQLEASGKKLQTHSPEVMFRARLSADAAGVSPAVYNSPTFHQHPEGRIHVRDAYLRQTAAIGDDAASQANMDKFVGGNVNEANDIKEASYKVLQNRDRFNSSKEPGTGYRYNPGLNNLDIKTDKFRASNGEAIPMSQTDHPEHPGFDLEGSHVGFKGSVRTGTHEDGTPMYEALKHPKTGDDLHEGWHPYNTHEGRVFEKHSIPEDAIHHGDIVEQGMQTGESPAATLRKLAQGKESAITANGLALTKQPSGPIKGAGGFDPKPLPAGPDFSGVPVTQGEGLPKPELNMEDTWTSRRGAAHSKHEEAGTLVTGCKACSLKASQASRDNHANIAGTFIPPTPRRGRVGTGPAVDGEVPTRPLTEAERGGKRNIPTTDDSKTKVFNVDTPQPESSDIVERTKVGPKPNFNLGHGSLDEISAAHAGGHIDGDEAYELAADAGHLRGAKPQYTKDPE